jgi:predicted N-acetyltransferase YhbS
MSRKRRGKENNHSEAEKAKTMSKRPRPEQLFLEEDPTPDRCWQALSLNVQACYERLTQAGGGEIVREGGIMAADGHMTIASVDPLQIGDHLDRILDWYRGRRLEREAICWYLHPAPPGDLEARLFARGFALNWQPHWMWCDLRSLHSSDDPPSPFDIQVVENEPVWHMDDLPNYDPQEAPVLAALHRAYPQHAPSLIAFQNHQVVGRCMLTITTGAWGIAGLFAMGVVPSARRQGIGTALARTACTLAQQMGCHHVVLNATPMGEPVYRRVGFQSMGYGHTWLLPAQTLATSAPTKDQVRFLEAVGRGDLLILADTGKRLAERVLHEPLSSGLTPLDIAVRCHQPESAAWLVEHGVPLDLLSAWDLGWKEQIPRLLAEQPELVNLKQGEWHAAALQIAIERGDLELAKLLLTVPNDLSIKDAAFQATAMGWAHHFQRTEIIALIERHRS